MSSSDLCTTHIRAAWPITAQGIKLWMRYQREGRGVFEPQTTCTVSILGVYITPHKLPLPLLTVLLCCTKAQGKIYGDELQEEIRNSHFLFASGLLVSLFVPVIAVMGQRCQ